MSDDHAIHRLYRHFQELPISMRVLFTGALLVLGMGYMFAMLYVFAAHSGADGKPGLSVDDIKITYSGSSETTQLESALQGPMSNMLPQKDLATIFDWIRDGADKKTYTSSIEAIVADNCLACHDGSNPHLSNLDFIMGFIFSHSYVRPVWLKSVIIAMPFFGVIADVLGWYVTKVYTPFAWVVLIAGAINGLSFAIMWFVSMYQMWIYRVPEHVSGRHESDPDTNQRLTSCYFMPHR